MSEHGEGLPGTFHRCRVYWGTPAQPRLHGCALERGHEGGHACDCAGRGGSGYPLPDQSLHGEDASRSLR